MIIEHTGFQNIEAGLALRDVVEINIENIHPGSGFRRAGLKPTEVDTKKVKNTQHLVKQSWAVFLEFNKKRCFFPGKIIILKFTPALHEQKTGCIVFEILDVLGKKILRMFHREGNRNNCRNRFITLVYFFQELQTRVNVASGELGAHLRKVFSTPSTGLFKSLGMRVTVFDLFGVC